MAKRVFNRIPGPGIDSLLWVSARLLAAGLLNATALLKLGFYEPVVGDVAYGAIKAACVLALMALYIAGSILRSDRRTWLRRRVPELAVFGISLLMWPLQSILTSLGFLLLFLMLFARFYVVLAHLINRYAILFLSSFAAMIVVGAGLLMLPRATPEGDPITMVDALFTATSAVCVTGLIVRDTATQFTDFGRFIILVLVQTGGLGIVIFGALFATMLGGSISLKHAASLEEAVSSITGGAGKVEHLVRFVVFVALGLEAIGAGLIYLGLEGTSSERAFQSTFLAVSAFCNAGFSPFSDSLVTYRWHWVTHAVIVPLIVLGGLGFPVLANLLHVGWTRLRVRLRFVTPQEANRDRLVRIQFHTKLVLVSSAILYVGGAGAIFVSQLMPFVHDAAGLNVTANAPAPPTLDIPTVTRHALDASFMSVTCRTAGFNAMPMSELEPGSRFVSMILMWIGGSPGSTAGGVKTISVCVLVMALIATIRGRSSPEAFGRTLRRRLVNHAGTLVILGLATTALTTWGLSLSESPGLENQLFESISAASTVGLSLGLTDQLHLAGKWIIIGAMFAGRVGPLAVIGAMFFRGEVRTQYHYPEEDVIMG